MQTATATTSSTAQRPNYVIRTGGESDEGFVVKCWTETARASTQMRAIDSTAFTGWHMRMANELLDRSELRIAAPPDNDETIYGFSVVEPKAVHIVYVRKSWRNFGIATALLRGLDLENASFSTWSQDVQGWIRDKYRGLRYLPYWMNSNG